MGRALSGGGAFAADGIWNTRAVHAAEVPAAAGVEVEVGCLKAFVELAKIAPDVFHAESLRRWRIACPRQSGARDEDRK